MLTFSFENHRPFKKEQCHLSHSLAFHDWTFFKASWANTTGFYESLGWLRLPWASLNNSGLLFPSNRLDVTSRDAVLCKQKQMAPSSWATLNLLFFLSISLASVSRKSLQNILPRRRRKVWLQWKQQLLLLHATVMCFHTGSIVGDVPQMFHLFHTTD